MRFLESKRKRNNHIWIGAVLIIITAIGVSCAVYLNDYYRADKEAIAAFDSEGNFTKQMLEDNSIVYVPENVKDAFIFYPGGKVEYTAYTPLMEACASEGIMCVLVEMPFNLAVFDIDAAKGIQEIYPEVENWYIGGHSLGGSMAASYVSKNSADFEGLVLLGSYSTEDLSATDLDVLTVYGSEDKVMNLEKYNKNKTNLPNDFTEIVIDGGCHAYFGIYGKQDGDGIPTISNAEQIYQTADAIAELMNR